MCVDSDQVLRRLLAADARAAEVILEPLGRRDVGDVLLHRDSLRHRYAVFLGEHAGAVAR